MQKLAVGQGAPAALESETDIVLKLMTILLEEAMTKLPNRLSLMLLPEMLVPSVTKKGRMPTSFPNTLLFVTITDKGAGDWLNRRIPPSWISLSKSGPQVFEINMSMWLHSFPLTVFCSIVAAAPLPT